MMPLRHLAQIRTRALLIKAAVANQLRRRAFRFPDGEPAGPLRIHGIEFLRAQISPPVRGALGMEKPENYSGVCRMEASWRF